MASIYLRGKVWWVGFIRDGKHIKYSLKTRDKTVAKFKKNEIENRLAAGDSPVPFSNVNPKDVLDEYVEHCRNRITPTTLSHYRIYVKDVLENIGAVRFQTITEERVNDYINDRYKKGTSKSTAHHIIRYLKTFLNYCVKRNYLKSNPIENIALPRLEQTKHRFLSKDEIERILGRAAEVGLKEYVTFAVYTGMRPSELRRLTWKDIDFENNLILAQKTKTKRSRAIPIHHKITELNLTPKEGLIFDWKNMRSRFNQLKELAKIEGIDLYTFRHTFISHLIMAGADLVTVKTLAGHSRIETTMIYSHLSDAHIKNAIDRLNF